MSKRLVQLLAATVGLFFGTAGLTALAAEPEAGAALYLSAVQTTQPASPNPGELQRQIVLLTAATKLAPDLTPAWKQLTEMAQAVGRPDLAQRAVQAFLATNQPNALMQMQWIELQLLDLQTVEAGRDFLEQLVGNENALLPEVVSDVYRRLAELAWQSYDPDRARKFLDLAIRTAPLNLKAQRMQAEMDWPSEPKDLGQRLAARLTLLLAEVRANPLNADIQQQIAVLAGSAGIEGPFHVWLDRRRKLLDHFDLERAITPEQRLEIAEAALAAEAYQTGLDVLWTWLNRGQATTSPATQTAPATQPDDQRQEVLEARMRLTLAVLAQKADQPEILQEQEQWIERQYQLLLTDESLAPEAAAMTGIYCAVYARDLDNPTLRALRFANYAYLATPRPSRPAILASALAYARAEELPGAIRLLDELNQLDQPLGILAKIWVLEVQKKTEELLSLLEEKLPTVGPGPIRQKLEEAWSQRTGRPVPQPDFQTVRQMLDQFDPAALQIAYNPQEHLRLTLATHGDLAQGDFVRVEAVLENTGKTPLSLAPGSFVDPTVVVAITPDDSNVPPCYLRIDLDARQVLEPGRSVSAAALLNAAQTTDGVFWPEYMVRYGQTLGQPKVLGQVSGTMVAADVRPVVLVKAEAPPLDVPPMTEQRLAELIESLAQANSVTSTWGNLAALYLRDPRFDEATQGLVGAMAQRLADADAETTAVLAFVLRHAEGTPAVFNALAAVLSRPGWLDRLAALDSVGRLQGPAAKPLYEYYARNDADPLVRQLATAYLLMDQNGEQP